MRSEIRFASCMAPNMDPMFGAVAAHVADVTGFSIEVVDDIPWLERQAAFIAGDVQVAWMCGLTYVRLFDGPERAVELLAAPVPAGTRYAAKPVYFSDVMVPASSRARSFDDLTGARWAINEPDSHSGCSVVRYTLGVRGQRDGYFRHVVQSGSHQATLRLLRAGTIDGSAIDSTVFDVQVRDEPELGHELHTVASFGPSPIPPFVIRTDVALDVRAGIRDAMTDMHNTQAGRRALAMGLMKCVVPVKDSDYDPIRAMARQAETVHL